jgi:hypothetical protein
MNTDYSITEKPIPKQGLLIMAKTDEPSR